MKKIVALVLSLVMVLGLATTAFGAAPTLKLWAATDDETAPWAEIGEWSTTLDKIVYGDEVGENSLPYYNTSKGQFVDCAPAVATHKFTYGATTTYVMAVADLDDLAYMAPAVALKVTYEDVCGMVKVAKADVAKTFYASYNPVTGDLAAVFVADKKADTNVLVDGKLVAATAYTTYTEVDHSWVGYDVVDNAYTTVKCEYCEKVATLYANKTAAGKNAEYVDGLGWITEAAAGYTAAGAVVAPSTDKVESAETFDAGIAMYVGMSVMAAAGSAVVLKKKD